MQEKKSVLVLDDDELTHLIAIEELGDFGWEVLIGNINRDILPQVEDLNPNLIVMGVRMGEGRDNDGLVWLSEIKRNYPSVPVILYTAFEDLEEEAKKRGADAVVVKSYNWHDLREAVLVFS